MITFIIISFYYFLLSNGIAIYMYMILFKSILIIEIMSNVNNINLINVILQTIREKPNFNYVIINQVRRRNHDKCR